MAKTLDQVDLATKTPVPPATVAAPAVIVTPAALLPEPAVMAAPTAVVPEPTVSLPPPPITPHPRKKWPKWVLAAAVERGLIQSSVTATRTLNAVVDVQVGSQVSGNIKALYADWNTKVTKGQLVALIDPAPFQAQVDQAQASLSSAHAATLTLAAQIAKANSDVAGTVAGGRGVESIVAKDRANELNAKT